MGKTIRRHPGVVVKRRPADVSVTNKEGLVSRRFEPWKADRVSGVKLAVYSALSAIVAAGLVIKGYFWAALGFALAALILGKSAAGRFRRARNREFGKAFEEEFIERASRELIEHRLTPRANVMARGIGDIDLVVCSPKTLITVEVKSFRKWNSFLVFNGDREKRAMLQADRQRRALMAEHGIVWLPQGRPTFLQRLFGVGSGNVSVVFGNERALVRAVKRIV
jgi:Holliday junction resolvase-like predicted endonuclease